MYSGTFLIGPALYQSQYSTIIKGSTDVHTVEPPIVEPSPK